MGKEGFKETQQIHCSLLFTLEGGEIINRKIKYLQNRKYKKRLEIEHINTEIIERLSV